jgi:nucleoside phosphorylase
MGSLSLTGVWALSLDRVVTVGSCGARRGAARWGGVVVSGGVREALTPIRE